MSWIVFGSACGSPGVSTVAWLIGQAFTRPVVLVEADPAGGRMALRHGLSADPGLVRLAGSTRLLGTDVLGECSQPVGNVRVVCGPPRAVLARAVLGELDGRWVSVPESADVIVDAGRLGPWTPAGVVRRAQLVVVVLRPIPDEVAVAQGLIAELRAAGRLVRIVVVGDAPYTGDEVAAVLDAELLCVLAVNPVVIGRLLAGERRGWRSPLGATFARVGAGLATEFADRPVTDPVSVPVDGLGVA